MVYFAAIYYVPRFRQDKDLFLIVGLTIFFNAIGMEWLYKALEQYTYITVRSIIFKFIAIVAMFLMNDYCTFVLSDYSDIVNQKILIPERDMEFLPYQGWSAANPAQSLTFWNGFCKIKHSRYANIQMANQKNVLYALGALYLLEMKYLSKIATSNEPDVPNKKSELFELDNWTYHYTPMGEMFACIEGEVCQLDDEN